MAHSLLTLTIFLTTLLTTTSASTLQPRKDNNPLGPNGKPCTSATCPPSLSVYGYAPSLGANAFFTAFFAGSVLLQLGLAIRWRSWSFGACMAVGCAGELVGYAGRIMLHSNWFSTTA